MPAKRIVSLGSRQRPSASPPPGKSCWNPGGSPPRSVPASAWVTGTNAGETMATTTKKELIDRIADETQLKRADVKKAVQAFLDHVIEELGRGNRLEFRDFGVFEIKDRAPRVAQNPKTLAPVQVPAKRTVKFKVGRLMKASIDGEPVERDAGSDPDES